MRRLAVLCLALAVLPASSQIVPAPKKLATGAVARQIGPMLYPAALSSQVDAFKSDWPGQVGGRNKPLTIVVDPKLGPEAYRLSNGKQLKLVVGGSEGAAWGLQTLGLALANGVAFSNIEDEPDYGYRSVMIDVARRYHSISTLRRIVRWCQLGKVRYLQLHLTDDQNWMLPTEVLKGIDARNSHKRPAYTRQELVDLQAYAEARGVSVIPEVDLPGHSTILCAYDPDTFRIQGSPSTNCINFASPLVRSKMTALLGEVATLFKNSPYIHIGGDEAWYPTPEKDPHFASSGKSAEHLFVDFVAELSNAVLAKGKTPIVWEGFRPSDDKYAVNTLPNKLVVVAWEGDYYPGDQLMRDGFTLINAGWDPGYVVNHYPWDAYTLVPLPRMYRWDPTVFGLVVGPRSTKLEVRERLRGGLMCWWEGHEWNAQRILPARIATFGARLWNGDGERNFAVFDKRVRRELERIDQASFPYRLKIEGAVHRTEFTDKITLSAASDRRTTVAFRTDGQIPAVGDTLTQVALDKSAIVTVQAFREGKPYGETQFIAVDKVQVVPNLALGKKVTTTADIDPDFPPARLTDGVADVVGSYWLGYPNPVSATIDLGEPTQINRVDVVAFWAAGQAARYRVLVSVDGQRWDVVADASEQKQGAPKEGYLHVFAAKVARYVKLECVSSDQHPASMSRIHEVRVFMDPK